MNNIDTLPKVIIRRSWVVLTFCEDDDGDNVVYDEEFVDHEEALLFAAQEADKHRIGITYGHVSD